MSHMALGSGFRCGATWLLTVVQTLYVRVIIAFAADISLRRRLVESTVIQSDRV